MSFTVNPYGSKVNGHEPEGYWVVYSEEPDESYCIRPLPNDLQQRLLEKHTRSGRGGIPKLNRETYYKALYSWLIADWEGIYEDEEKLRPLECTDEAKYALYCTSSQRADFIWEESQRLANNDAARKEAQRKSFRNIHPTENRQPVSEL